MISKNYEKMPDNIASIPSENMSLKNALMRLKEFSSKMEKSDFKNSYTRYTTELKLVMKAIDECEEKDDKSIEALKAYKNFLLDKLKTFGVYYE